MAEFLAQTQARTHRGRDGWSGAAVEACRSHHRQLFRPLEFAFTRKAARREPDCVCLTIVTLDGDQQKKIERKLIDWITHEVQRCSAAVCLSRTSASRSLALHAQWWAHSDEDLHELRVEKSTAVSKQVHLLGRRDQRNSNKGREANIGEVEYRGATGEVCFVTDVHQYPVRWVDTRRG